MVADLSALDPRIAERICHILQQHSIPGAVVAAVRKDESYVMTYGVKRAGSNDRVTPCTAFDVGSCSKSYVSAAIGLLAGERTLRLDDPVRRYVPEIELDDPWVSDHVTIRDLLSNRTGLARQQPIEAFPNPEIGIADILRRVKHIRRIRPFRGGYVYFNIGFMICALIVERVSGLPYAKFLEERLFARLGMSGSASGRRAYEVLDNRALGHTVCQGRIITIEEQAFENTQGAGGVFSSASDALSWLRFHLGEGRSGQAMVIDPAILRELHQPHTIIPLEDTGLMHCVPEASLCAYCLGWWTSEFHGRRIVQHSGGMFGWRAQTSFIPGSEVGAAVYLNMAKNVHHVIAYMVLESLLGISSRAWESIAEEQSKIAAERLTRAMLQAFPCSAGEAATRPLADYQGCYRHPAAGVVEVVADGSHLLLKFMDGRLWDMTLKHFGGDVFEAEFARPEVRDYLPVPAHVRFVVEGDRVIALEEPSTRFERQD